MSKKRVRKIKLDSDRKIAFNKFTMSENLEILIKEKTDYGVIRFTMNDLVSKNALSKKLIGLLIDELKSVSLDKSIKVVVLAAKGNVFSAGHDLKEITAARKGKDNGEAFFKDLFNLCSELMQLIIKMPQPVIAEINGIATAAGCQLVASCDLALASSESQFATPGVNIGLFCSTPMVALSRNVNKKAAMHMLLTVDLIYSEKAKYFGLINETFQKPQLTDEVNKLAKKIANKSSMTIKIGKKAFYNQAEMSLSKAYEYTSMTMIENLLNHDAKEGIDAFLGKRTPDWKND